MKNTAHNFVLRMAIMAILTGSATVCSASIALVPSSPAVSAGSAFTVDIVAKDMNLGGFDFTLAFRPLLASFDGADFGPYLGAPNSFQAADPQIDTITLDELSFEGIPVLTGLQGPAGAGNQFRLATLHFTALTAGAAAFDIQSSFLTDLVGNTITTDVTGTVVNVTAAEPPPTPTPEPALLAPGIALLAIGWSRRRGQAAVRG